jgi:hypothetical protein
VRFVVRTRLLAPGDSLLEVRVRAVNAGRSIRTLAFGNCSLNVGVSSVGLTPARTWEYVVWASSQRPPLGCLDYVATRDLAPGDSVSPADFTRRVPIRAIRGHSLPPGRYRIPARDRAHGQRTGTLEGGEVELRPRGWGAATAAGGDGSGSSDSPLP